MHSDFSNSLLQYVCYGQQTVVLQVSASSEEAPKQSRLPLFLSLQSVAHRDTETAEMLCSAVER